MSNLLTVGSRFAKAAKPGQLADELVVGDWLEMLKTRHSFDAHAWPYVRYFDGEPAPSVRAAVQPGTGDTSTDGQFLCWFIFLDYDQSNDYPAIMERLERVPQDSVVFRACAIYPTKSGMRLVYRLEEPLLLTEYPAVVRGLAMELMQHTGLQVDPTTDQWSRCFRLPSVVREDGKADGPTWEQPYFFEPIISEDVTILPEEVRKRPERLPWDTRGRKVELAGTERPGDDETIDPVRHRLYQRALRASRFKEYIFDKLPITAGRRDSTLVSMVGEVVARCFRGVPESTAEELYVLLLPVVLSFDQDKGESWTAKLWRLVQHVWNAEAKKDQERSTKDASERTERERIVLELLKQLPGTEVPVDDVEREAYVKRHYCLQTPSGAYVVSRTGEYMPVPLKATQLPAHFNDNLQCLVEGGGFRDERGRPISGQEILNRYSTNVEGVQYVAGKERGCRVMVDGDKRYLQVSPFGIRPDLLDSAQPDPEVGEWLDTFRDSMRLQRWLAAALALDLGPVAACYLNGPARVGKSMIARALAECFGCEPTPASQAFGEFNGGLMTSPVVLIDEGMPVRLTGMDSADLFRSLVTGSAISLQKKFQDQVVSNIPYRLLFAANSYDMVRSLIGRRSLGAQDREAFRERILVIETGDGPSHYLDRRGAMEFTMHSPRGSWVGGQCRLARHIVWLYRKHFIESKFPRDGRLLVEGSSHPAFTLAFDLSGAGRDVIDQLNTCIEQVHTRKGATVELFKCIQIDMGNVWLRKRPFVRYCCPRGTTQAEQFAAALDRFLTGETRTSSQDMTTQCRVDLDKVAFCATSEGLSTVAIAALRLRATGIA